MDADEREERFDKVVKGLKKSFDPAGENNPIPVGSTADDVARILTNELDEKGVAVDPEKVREEAQEIVDTAPQ